MIASISKGTQQETPAAGISEASRGRGSRVPEVLFQALACSGSEA